MILLDLNQVVIASVMVHARDSKDGELNEQMIRHMVLNTIRSYNRQFKMKYGRMVLCCDSRHYWRKNFFPNYKVHRKKDRDKSKQNWQMVFDTLARIKQEIREDMGYQVIEVDLAEADDIIGTLAPILCTVEPVLIISSDKDFMQLQIHPNIDQYSPTFKNFIRSDDPVTYLREHILRGDKSDGIPNFLSDDDTLVSGKRQKPLNKKRMTDWVTYEPEFFLNDDDSTIANGYHRNHTLVDLSNTPHDIKNEIIMQFHKNPPPRRTKTDILNYFIKKGLKDLSGKIEDF